MLYIYICQILHLKNIYLKLDIFDRSYAFDTVVMGVHLNEGISDSNPKHHNIYTFYFILTVTLLFLDT